MIQVGTSGWYYPHWLERFYPGDLPKHRWFEFYAERFRTVELNSSFYRIPTAKTVKGWARKAPDGFVFSVKIFRGITHLKKLRGVEPLIKSFFDVLGPLGARLGCVLHQLPPSLHRDICLLDEYLTQLPFSLSPQGEPIRHAVEFRHRSWEADEVFEVLRARKVAICTISMSRLPEFKRLTAEFFYIRMHGPTDRYSSSYSAEELKDWAAYIKDSGVQDGYVYFNNDFNAHAVANAQQLIRLLGGRGAVSGSRSL